MTDLLDKYSYNNRNNTAHDLCTKYCSNICILCN